MFAPWEARSAGASRLLAQGAASGSKPWRAQLQQSQYAVAKIMALRHWAGAMHKWAFRVWLQACMEQAPSGSTASTALAQRRRRCRGAMEAWRARAACSAGCRRAAAVAALRARRRKLRGSLTWWQQHLRRQEAHATLPLRAQSYNQCRLLGHALRAWLLQLLYSAAQRALVRELRRRVRLLRLPGALGTWSHAAVSGKARRARLAAAVLHFAVRLCAWALKAWGTYAAARRAKRRRQSTAMGLFAAAARGEALRRLEEEREQRAAHQEAAAVAHWPAQVHLALPYLLAWQAAAHASRLQAHGVSGGGVCGAVLTVPWQGSAAVETVHLSSRRARGARAAEAEGFLAALRRRIGAGAFAAAGN